jgi:meso-butanediol dehydrogenase/(S,S)-butanediol dehydrogenase/diacetyl reductase
MARLQGKTCFVAGAAGGIGSAIARGLAEHGASVVLTTAHNTDGLQAVADQIAADGGKVLAIKADATEGEEMRAAVEAAVDAFGQVDVLFNLVGRTGFAPLDEVTRESWDEVMSINAYSVIVGAQAVRPTMRKQGKGKIVNMCSVAGKQGFGQHILYTASKFAVRGMTHSLAQELGAEGITVNGIAPGIVETPLWKQIAPTFRERGMLEEGQSVPDLYASAITLGRKSVPEDLIGIAVFLASADSDYMTGQLVSVDGGLVYD